MSAKASPRGSTPRGLPALLALLLAFGLGASSAQANRTLVTKTAVFTNFCLNCVPTPPPPLIPPTEGQIEGPCGLAVASGSLYVSEYYHRLIDVYSTGGNFQSQITAVAPAPEGPCGLASGPGGALYANIWHQRVVRLKPSLQTFDTVDSTGVAVDPLDGTGKVYVDDRKYVAVYESSGAKVLDKKGEQLRIGLGSIGDGFGVAVYGGKVYVPDAAGNTVKVYEPAVDPLDPVATIGDFNSLVDAGVAVDPTNGHLLVVDNLKPGYEHPQSAVYEFDSAGAFLGQLPGAPVHGEPSGIAVDPATGNLYVTDGNSEESNVFAYGPFGASGSEALAPPSGGSSAGAASVGGGAALASPQPGLTDTGQRPSQHSHRAGRRSHKRGRHDKARIGIGERFAASAASRDRAVARSNAAATP